jgi:hypothetical protein
MRTPILMLVTAVTTLAVAAPLISAETEVPATEEGVTVTPADPVCSTVTIVDDTALGTCGFRLTSDGSVDVHSHTIFGETLRFRCLLELEGAIDAQGEGWIGRTQVSVIAPVPPTGVDCTGANGGAACDMAAAEALGTGHDENWHLRTVEDHTTGTTWLAVSLCFKGLDPTSYAAGDLWLRITETGGQPTSLAVTDHRLRNQEVDITTNIPDFEFTGTWDFESTTHTGLNMDH